MLQSASTLPTIERMVWLRKGLVHFLAFVLLVSLLAGVWLIGLNHNFGKPDKVKTWIANSKVYDRAVSAVLDSSQDDSVKNGTTTSVSLKDPNVQAAAKQAFSPQLLQQSVNTFIDANYAWLQGKTATPQFDIDLTSAKQDFANRVGKYVETRLSSLPVCTPEQQAQLQIPVDALSVNCRPSNLDPKAEGSRVAQEMLGSDFLGKPVITADTLSRNDQNANSKPYYVQASQLPRIYRLMQNAPLIFGLIALVSILLIIVIAPERRRGWRRVAVILIVAGLLLVISKVIADAGVRRLETNNSNDTVASQLREPRNQLLNSAENELTRNNMLFGVIYIALAIIIIGGLYQTRDGKPRKSKVTEVPTTTSSNRPPSPKPVTAKDLDLAPRPRPTGPPSLGSNPPKRKPPKLIQ
jgi:hypothetical protein